jgi:hypothetical protein
VTKVRFDNTISLGTILSMITLLIALATLANRIDARITVIETEIAPLWHDYTSRIKSIQAEALP